MLIVDAFIKTWPVCLSFITFFVGVALLVTFHRSSRLEIDLPASPIFWVCTVLWLTVMSVSLTLIDKPHYNLSDETKDWLFMFSAFLFIPLAVPLMAGAVLALAHGLLEEPLPLGKLALVCLGAFGLGCAASNIHDVAWCGAITSGYTQHHMAGYDLDVFAAYAAWFGVPRDVSTDYATLGPCAAVLVAGELLVSAACYARLRRPT